MHPGINGAKFPDKPALYHGVDRRSGHPWRSGPAVKQGRALLPFPGSEDRGLHRHVHGEQPAFPRDLLGRAPAGLYYACTSSYLTAPEVAYIVNDCEAQVFISSGQGRRGEGCTEGDHPDCSTCLMVSEPDGRLSGLGHRHRRHARHAHRRRDGKDTTCSTPRARPGARRASRSTWRTIKLD